MQNLLEVRRRELAGKATDGDRAKARRSSTSRDSQAEQLIAQRYVEPALIASPGRKYHLRLYVVIAQHDPLVLAMSLDHAGLVLVAAKPYHGAGAGAPTDTDKYRGSGRPRSGPACSGRTCASKRPNQGARCRRWRC